jgi:hypothetical protein
MKWIKTLLSVFVAVALTSTPMFAAEKEVRDANGDKWIVDTETEATPGAGSGLGALIGAVDDTLAGFEKHKFDLQLGLTAIGQAGDDSSATESALTSVTLYHRPVPVFRWGPRFSWNTVDNNLFSFSLPMGLKLNRNPWATYNFWLNLDILPTFTVRTDEPVDTSRTSAWSYTPKIAFAAEVPMGPWSIEGDLGVGFPFAIEGVTDDAINSAVKQVGFAAKVAVNIRLRS